MAIINAYHVALSIQKAMFYGVTNLIAAIIAALEVCLHLDLKK